jgi:beta-xylosidase
MGTLWCNMSWRLAGRNAATGGVAALLLACAPAPPTPPAQADAPPAARPVLNADFPDPFVLPVGDGLFAYATNTRQGGRRLNIQVSRSIDGVSWSVPSEAMPAVPAWALASRSDLWAPEAIRIGKRYVLYFSARHATRMRPDGRSLCVGAAVAAAPEGPFVPQPQPLTCGGTHGVIDASPFRDGDALWLYVKTDGNCCDAPTGVQALPLTADGLAPAGAPVTLRGLAADRPWEGRVVEAPHMVKVEGRYLMFYAGNDYGGAYYATGYATCDSATGPCRDAAENPILHSNDGAGIVGPGHPAVVRRAGRTWIIYHGWRAAHDGGARYRAMYIDRLDWSDGRPLVVRR